MNTHHASPNSVLLWAIRYTLASNDWRIWDGIRLCREYLSDLDAGYRDILAKDINTWLNTHPEASPGLRAEWESILSEIDHLRPIIGNRVLS